MSQRGSSGEHLRRLRIIGIFIMTGFLALAWRLVDLSVMKRYFLQKQWSERTTRDVVLRSYRGMISDRNAVPLAISMPVYALWYDPKNIQAIDMPSLSALSSLLQLSESKIRQSLQQSSQNSQKKHARQFVYLKRDLSPNVSDKIKALGIKGLFLEKQYHRFYPSSEVTAQIIGMTNIDDKGQEGLELLYNEWLSGKSGLERMVKDRYGNPISRASKLIASVTGRDLTLSIDNRLQSLAYHALLDGVNHFQAEYGSIIVLNIHTGEVLAMANVPSFNPNARHTEKTGHYRNRCLTDIFEPGSTIKPFAMAVALSTGKFTPNTMINTSPGYWYVEGKKIDDDGHNEGVINLTKILEVSSNVGMSKVILSVKPKVFLTFLDQLGFGRSSHLYFPGESKGVINKNALHSAFVYATISFGYSISVNLLQLASAYATLANDGVKLPVSLLKLDSPPAGVSVIDPKVAKQIRGMLEYVLAQGGTGTAARVSGYRVTGKTGTARILGAHGYEKHHHNSLFVGIAPASHPEVVVAVFMHDPLKRAYFGGFVAGPVFSNVMGNTLRILNIPPDNINPLTANKLLARGA